MTPRLTSRWSTRQSLAFNKFTSLERGEGAVQRAALLSCIANPCGLCSIVAMELKKLEHLYSTAMLIREGKQNGPWLGMIEVAALRGHAWAMLEWASWLNDPDRGYVGNRRAWDLCRKALRKGQTMAGQHLAMNCFNQNNLVGYRYWLARAAAKGDEDCKADLKRFNTRLPHTTAFLIGRGRPRYANEGYGTRRPI